MSVQTSYDLYQAKNSLGVLTQSNPSDTGTYVVSENSTFLTWGVFVKSLGTATGKDAKTIIELSSATDTVIGATLKQLNRVSQELQGYVKDTTPNSAIDFYLTAGKPATVARMGYLGMPVVGQWVQGRKGVANKVYVRIAQTSGSGIIGEVANDYSALDVPANWAQFALTDNVEFADSGIVSGNNNIASVYFDFRTNAPTLSAATNT